MAKTAREIPPILKHVEMKIKTTLFVQLMQHGVLGVGGQRVPSVAVMETSLGHARACMTQIDRLV